MTQFSFPVDGPRPQPPLLSLPALATIIDEPEDRWQGGLGVWPYPCGDPVAWDPCSAAGAGRDKDADAGPAAVTIAPFAAIIGFTCGTRGLPIQAFRDRAMIAFAAREHLPVEAEFWTAALMTTNPSLAGDSPTLLNSGTALGVVAGIGALEAQIKGRGVLHVTPALFASMHHHYLVLWDRNNQPRTPSGHLIIPGQGYPGTGPSSQGVGATTDYAYVTGLVEVRRGQPEGVPSENAQAITRSTNDFTVYVERVYAITVDTCTHAAALIDRAA